MIDFVLKGARKKSGALALLRLTCAIEAFNHHARRTDDGRVEAGQAQAAFLLELHAVADDELRVDHHDERRVIASDGDIHDEDSQRDADLRRGQADAGRRIHRLDEVVDQPIDVGRDLGDARGAVVQRLVAVFEDRANHRT